MNSKNLNLFYFFTLIFAISLFESCSDDSSNSGSGVDHGIIDIPISPDILDESTNKYSSETLNKNLSSSSINNEPSNKDSILIQINSCSSLDNQSSNSDEIKKNWRELCLDDINQYRAYENLPPLSLARDEKQECTDKEAHDDLNQNTPHGHFGNCGEWAQNSGPNINLKWMNDTIQIVNYYNKMMWDEKKLIESGERDPNKKEDYSYIGHYLNMTNTQYTQVSCGFAINNEGTKAWFNVNFF